MDRVVDSSQRNVKLEIVLPYLACFHNLQLDGWAQVRMGRSGLDMQFCRTSPRPCQVDTLKYPFQEVSGMKDWAWIHNMWCSMMMLSFRMLRASIPPPHTPTHP